MSDYWLNLYRYLPYHINQDVHLGPFSVSWYSLMYLVTFFVVYFLTRYRIRRGEFGVKREITVQDFPPKADQLPVEKSSAGRENRKLIFDAGKLLDLMIWTFAGLLIGARIGYVLFYNFSFYADNPLLIISPFDPLTREFVGLYGMSYHGGLVGAVAAAAVFCRRNKLDFWSLANFLVPAIPAGYFFGRIGNFLNGELYGRTTDQFWGMYFPRSQEVPGVSSLSLRHPSQLYEAFLEGAVLFVLLWIARNNKKLRAHMLSLYLAGYAIARIMIEFFREPDEQIGLFFGYLTLGQLFSVAMLVLALIIFWKKNKGLL